MTMSTGPATLGIARPVGLRTTQGSLGRIRRINPLFPVLRSGPTVVSGACLRSNFLAVNGCFRGLPQKQFPSSNPARPECQLVGVFSREWCPSFAEILQRLGRESAWVVHGTTGDGRSVDEVSLMGSTRVCKSGTMEDIVDEEVRPRDFDMKHAEVADLQGGDATTNAAILEAILDGRETGPKRDMVLLNAGAALACCGLADDIGEGIELSRQVIDDGSALDRLRALQSIAT
ncbi:hypothetical protein [Haloferula sp. A504]|uniref:hypothetical protein n=1 Tax=Haloferula sp. A504 TaxID=3373601 RepID=UPI0037AC707F